MRGLTPRASILVELIGSAAVCGVAYVTDALVQRRRRHPIPPDPT